MPDQWLGWDSYMVCRSVLILSVLVVASRKNAKSIIATNHIIVHKFDYKINMLYF